MMMKLSKGDSNGIVVEDTGVLSKVAGPQRSGQKKPLLATNTIYVKEKPEGWEET